MATNIIGTWPYFSMKYFFIMFYISFSIASSRKYLDTAKICKCVIECIQYMHMYIENLSVVKFLEILDERITR